MTTITALPTAPSRTDPATFSARSDALLGALAGFVTETNTVAGEVNANAATATTQAGLATTNGAAQVALATAQAASATASAASAGVSATSAAASANMKGDWSALTGALNIPASVSHGGKIWVLLANLADVTAATPGVSASWQDITPASSAYACQTTSAVITLPVGTAINTLAETVIIDSTHQLLIFRSGTAIQAVVYDSSAKSFGTAVLVRTLSASGFVKAILTTVAGVVLVTSNQNSTTAFQAVALTITGTSVSVGTAATATLPGAPTDVLSDMVAAGSSYIIGFGYSYSSRVIACTVSGSTVTIGTSLVVWTSGLNSRPTLCAIDATRILTVCQGAALSVAPVSVSGTTLTLGTTATTAATGTNPVELYGALVALSTGRFAVIYSNTQRYGGIITVTGTVATISVVALSATATGVHQGCIRIGDRLVTVTHATGVNALTDNAGTAVAGTELTIPGVTADDPFIGFGSDFIVLARDSTAAPIVVKLSGNDAVLDACPQLYFTTAVVNNGGGAKGPTGKPAMILSTGTKTAAISQTTKALAQLYDAGTWSIAVCPAVSYTGFVRQSDAILWASVAQIATTKASVFRMEMV